MLVVLTDADAAAEESRADLVRVLIPRIDGAIAAYRQGAHPEALARGGMRAAATLAGFVVILLLFLWVYRRGKQRRRILQSEGGEDPGSRTSVVETERLWGNPQRVAFSAGGLSAGCHPVLPNLLLGQFPWTRPFSKRVFDLVLNPLSTIGQGVAQSLPNLAFLVVLFIVFRYLLKLIRVIFESVQRGRCR